jgi:hypothetical protein
MKRYTAILIILHLIRCFSISQIKINNSFPRDCYTPHGYIDNPYHSMVLNRSGVLRSVPPLGFGFWLRDFPGSYGSGVKSYINYISAINNSLSIDGISITSTDDFKKLQINLCSNYHSKNIFTYDFIFANLQFSFKYFLISENSLACVVEIVNRNKGEKFIFLHSTNIYGLWETPWWGSDGLTSKYVKSVNAVISKIWAYGDVFALGSNLKPIAYKATGNQIIWSKWLQENDTTANEGPVYVRGSGPLYSIMSFKIKIKPNDSLSFVIILSRGSNESKAIENLNLSLKIWEKTLEEKLKEDDSFWQRCPTLIGDWPESWKHGWVYDFETLRMNVRKPIGIFKHPWDGMQIHSPRLVLAETSIDMLTLSYANPTLAKEVILGTFENAIAPNIPCIREDGSVNMISSDGSECGTAPMWCFPFKTILAIFLRTKDTTWVKKLYPYLKSYVNWWLENRIKDGWLTVNNSWESGQDISKRFLRDGKLEGDVVDFVAPVDLESSIAEAVNILANFAEVLNDKKDFQIWNSIKAEVIKKVNSMYQENWFWDIDIRTKTHILLDYYDVMQLSPIACGIVEKGKINSVKWSFDYFLNNLKYLEWPPFLLTYCEAAWNANERSPSSEAVSKIADKVYRRLDQRDILKVDTIPFMYRIPGVSCEFWPVDDKNPGGEAYGWGATLPTFIIRDILGIREKIPNENSIFEFSLSPIPPKINGMKKFGISNLQMYMFNIQVLCEKITHQEMNISLDLNSPRKFSVEITDLSNNIILNIKEKSTSHHLDFKIKNGEKYVVKLY